MAEGSERVDLEGGGAGTPDKKKTYCPMLDKKSLLENLSNLAMAALLGVTAINVLTSNQSLSRDTTKYKGLRQFLLAMPYTLFLFAIAVLAAALAIKRKCHMLGCAAGTLLAQLLCLVIIGGIVTQVRGEVDPKIVWPVTGGILVIVLFIWSVMCAYPKCLRCWLLCCRSKEKEKVDASDKKCGTCGGLTVNGRSPNPAGNGVHPCDRCWGVPPSPSRAPGVVRNTVGNV